MEIIEPKHKAVNKVFDVSNIAEYSLILKLMPESFSFTVFDKSKETFLVYEKHNFKKQALPEQYLAQLKPYMEQHNYLMAAFWKEVKIIYGTLDYAIVPQNFLDDSLFQEYIKLNTGKVVPYKDIHLCRSVSNSAACVFYFPNFIFKWFKEVYKNSDNFRVEHPAFCFHDALLQQNSPHTCVALNIQENVLQIIAIKDHKLIVNNSYLYFSPDDITYYLLLIYHQFSFSREEVPLLVWGDFYQSALLLSGTKRYIKNIEIGGRPKQRNFSYQFDEIPLNFEIDSWGPL